MKRSWRGVIFLSIILFLNIVITQLTVNNYFYQKYTHVVLLAAANLILFPAAIWIYRKEAKNG